MHPKEISFNLKEDLEVKRDIEEQKVASKKKY